MVCPAMNRVLPATNRAMSWLRPVGRGALLMAAALIANPASANASHHDAPLEQQLLAGITELASDDFAGREPGTEGEKKTLRYLARQWFDIGLVSGTNDPSHPWFAPVTLVGREPVGSRADFMRHGRPVVLAPDDVKVMTFGRRGFVQHAPFYFVGNMAGEVPPRTELAGRIAVLLDRAGPRLGGDVAPLAVRQNALLEGGAAAVLTVLDGNRTLSMVSERRRHQGFALADAAPEGDLEAYVTPEGMGKLMGGMDAVEALSNEAGRPDFAPHLLDLTASLEATTRQTTIRSHNVIGRLPGRHPEAGAVVLLAHWDHFGTCGVGKPGVPDTRPTDTGPHEICNGAIDNASGLAALTEIARRLAHQSGGMDRDVYFLATTGEEMGLLGAEAFADSPPLPLTQIVAAFNLDSIAIAPAGTPLGVVGAGMTRLDSGIAAVAREQHRRLIPPEWPNSFLKRQDGWALIRHDIPAVMVTSAYGDKARYQHYLDTDYHRPTDVVKPGLELGGAAEDVMFHIALVRYFADPRQWSGSAGTAER
jgi:hypothetical protein